MRRIAILAVSCALTILALAACGQGGTSQGPAPTPSPTGLTPAEKVSLEFLSSHGADLEGIYKKEQLAEQALSDGDLGSFKTYLDSASKETDKVVKAYDSFPVAGGRLARAEALWRASAADLSSMLGGMTAELNGQGPAKEKAAAIDFQTAFEQLKAQLNSFGVTI